MATATKVLTTLRLQGLVRPQAGVGTVVTESATVPTAEAAVPAAPPELEPLAPARPVRRRHEPRTTDQGLTRERIVRAAVEIADAEGIATLSMRRVASELGVATMALYRHVPSKEDLVMQMADAALGDEPFPDAVPDGWRTQLELLARLQWSIYRRHPWLAQTMSVTRPVPAPNSLTHAEWAIRALNGLPFDPFTKLHVHILMFSFVRGIAANIEMQQQAEHETGITAEEWMESQDSVLDSLMSAGTFPAFSQLMAEIDRLGNNEGFHFDIDTLFEFGLHRMLDSIGVLIDSRTAERP